MIIEKIVKNPLNMRKRWENYIEFEKVEARFIKSGKIKKNIVKNKKKNRKNR